MSTILGEVYGTTQQGHSEEDQQKLAQAEFFSGLCKQAGVQIEHLTDEQVKQLWKVAMDGRPEGAEPEPDKKKSEKREGDEHEKKAAAAREWEEKRAAAEKIAEADALGRIMAHAYVDELVKISEASSKSEHGKGGVPPQLLKRDEKKDKKEEDEEGEKKESQARATALIERLSKTASPTASSSPATSTTTNLDEVAGNHAIDLLKEAGVGPDVATARINAVYTLGLAESTKIASADSFDRAVTLRALEFCESAGFPVDWSKA